MGFWNFFRTKSASAMFVATIAFSSLMSAKQAQAYSPTTAKAIVSLSRDIDRLEKSAMNGVEKNVLLAKDLGAIFESVRSDYLTIIKRLKKDPGSVSAKEKTDFVEGLVFLQRAMGSGGDFASTGRLSEVRAMIDGFFATVKLEERENMDRVADKAVVKFDEYKERVEDKFKKKEGKGSSGRKFYFSPGDYWAMSLRIKKPNMKNAALAKNQIIVTARNKIASAEDVDPTHVLVTASDLENFQSEWDKRRPGEALRLVVRFRLSNKDGS